MGFNLWEFVQSEESIVNIDTNISSTVRVAVDWFDFIVNIFQDQYKLQYIREQHTISYMILLIKLLLEIFLVLDAFFQ